MARGVKNIKSYVLAENFNPFLNYSVSKDENGNIVVDESAAPQIKTIDEGSENFNKLVATGDYLIDERCQILSINNNTTKSLEFIFNYAKYNAFLANHAGMTSSSTIPYIDQVNPDLRKYINYGYIPIIFLPTTEINKWKAHLEAPLQALHLPTISVPTQSFTKTHRFRTYDTWVHRLDLHEKLMKDVPPEKIRMEDAVRRIFDII